MKITLKHVAREFGYEPHLLRRILRAEYGKVKSKRWSWEKETDKELVKVKKFLRSRTSSTGRTVSAASPAKGK